MCWITISPLPFQYDSLSLDQIMREAMILYFSSKDSCLHLATRIEKRLTTFSGAGGFTVVDSLPRYFLSFSATPEASQSLLHLQNEVLPRKALRRRFDCSLDLSQTFVKGARSS